MSHRDDCASPRLNAKGLCTCQDPKLCPYSEAGRKRVLELAKERGLLDQEGKWIQ